LAKSKRNEAPKARGSDANASLLRELNHRVKNNLQLMDSLLKLQIAEATGDGAREALTTARRRLRSLGVANTILLSRPEGTEFSLPAVLKRFSEESLDSELPSSLDMRIALKGDPVRIEADCIIPLGMITGEIIADALELARPGGHPVVMCISWDVDGDGAITIAYKDEGGAFPEGEFARSPESPGSALIRALAKQIRATIATADGERGAAITVTFRPLRPPPYAAEQTRGRR
jgi:two-component system, sensor histidine kinase PdtaS